MNELKTSQENIRLLDCFYPDCEGGFLMEKHTLESFDEDGFCQVCGMTIGQASFGKIKTIIQ